MLVSLRRLTVALALLVVSVTAHAGQAPNQAPQLRIETRMHTGAIWDIDASADGHLLLTGSDDKTARLWSADSGELIRIFRVPISTGAEGRIYAVALSPDGRLAAVGGWDHNYWQNYWTPEAGHFVYVFDTVSGSLLWRLGPLPQVVDVLAFSPDNRRLAAGLADPNHGLRVWDVTTGRFVAYDMGYNASMFGLDFRGDGALAAAALDGSVRLYDPQGNLIARQTVPGGPKPRTVRFSPNGRTLAVAQVDSTNIDLLDGNTLAPVGKFDTSIATNNDIYATGWSKDGKTFYAGGRYLDKDWEYPVLSWHNGQVTVLRDREKNADGGVSDLVTLPGNRFAYASQDSSFGIYGPAGSITQVHPPVIADMRNKYGDQIWTAPDLSAVWFGLKIGNGDPWLFDLSRLSFTPSPAIPGGFIRPNTDAIPVENWLGAFLPTLNGQVLALDPAEMSRSLAVAPDRQSFAVGTDWTINRFGEDGTRLWRKNVEGAVWGVSLSGDGRILIAALGDGTLRWYRYSDGAELLAFFVDVPHKKWIVWTPKGYYAASPGGEDLIGWNVNGKDFDTIPDFFPASRFRAQYYRPDVVQQVLTQMDEDKAIERANAAAGKQTGVENIRGILPAVVEFAEDSLEIDTATPDVTLHYRLRSPSGREITRVEVQIDGRPVTPRSAVPVDETADSKAVALTVPQRDSEVTLIAYIGDQPGVPVSMPIKWKGAAVTAKKPNLYALLIGVSNYANPDLKLQYAAKDARDLGAELERQRGVFYDKVEITELLDADASEIAIESELTKLRKKAKPEDNVIVFMAGHGYTNAAQDFYFLPANADLNPDMLEATAIDGDIIRKGLSRIPGKVVLFMDACHAGNGIQGGVSHVDMTGLANGLSDGASVVMFASSTGREVSYESSQWENGAFTEALLSIMEDKSAYGHDGLLSISELDENLTERVETLTDGKQTPVMTKPGAIKRFFIAAL
jgi:WD40 repeat protein